MRQFDAVSAHDAGNDDAVGHTRWCRLGEPIGRMMIDDPSRLHQHGNAN